MSAGVLAGLALLSLVAGVGITAVGPGGVLATIGLVVLTGLSPAAVAGTSIVTHIATGVVGTAAFWRSGQLRDRPTLRAAGLMVAAAVVGTPVGVLCNAVAPGRVFAILLGLVVALTGALVWVRERRSREAGTSAGDGPGAAVTVTVGFAVAVASGLFGIGGPMLAVPLLVLCGMPLLPALAAAQVQSVVTAAIGTASYAVQSAIDWPLALLVGVPEMVGVVLGWRIAHAVPTRTLKYVLAAVLLCLAPYVALQG